MSILKSIPPDWLERLKNNEFTQEDLEEFQELYQALDEARYCIGDVIKQIVKQRQMALLDWGSKTSFGEREGDFPVTIQIRGEVVSAEWRDGKVFEFPFDLFEETTTGRADFFRKEARAVREQQLRDIEQIKTQERLAREKHELDEYNRLREKFEGKEAKVA